MALARAFYDGEYTLERLFELTRIDRWFLYRMQNIIDTYKHLSEYSIEKLPEKILLESKQNGFSDVQIAKQIQR